MTALQGAPLMLGLLCLLVVALQTERLLLAAAIGIFATSFKATLALPFLGLLLLHRRYRATALAVGTLAGLSLLGFVRTGGMEAWHHFQANAALVEAFGDINTPDPWDGISIPRLDWKYLLYGLTRNLLLAKVGTLAAACAVGLWLVWQSRRARVPIDLTRTAAFLTPSVCLGCLAVYHHHYDVSLMIAPLLLTLLGPPALRRQPHALALMLPLTLLMVLLPVAKVQLFVIDHFGSSAIGFLNLSFPVAVTLALIGGLLVLYRCNTQSGHPTGLGAGALPDGLSADSLAPVGQRQP
jgi:hypothetical protein